MANPGMWGVPNPKTNLHTRSHVWDAIEHFENNHGDVAGDFTAVVRNLDGEKRLFVRFEPDAD